MSNASTRPASHLDGLVQLQNIGCFKIVRGSTDIAFRLLSLIYLENGRGKTTLCEMLRSLTIGDPRT